ncbi:sensor histidine kinase [Streptomyces sp. NPDC096310]|uniref:sensor histidine kinase n=1 Tax=Streptomyces sp. NPDC096310 TaxID=3366082 RepID=UPI003801CBEC
MTRTAEKRFMVRKKRCTGRRTGRPGPPPGYALLPWLLLGLGSFSNILQGETPDPWIGGIGLLVFNSLYISVVFRAFDRTTRDSPATRWSLVVMGVMTFGLAGAYGGSWLLFLPLFGLACGSVLRGRALARVGIPVSVAAAVTAAYHDGWGAVGVAYGTFISTMVTAALLTLSETVMELRDTRLALARSAVDQERLRFSRDLHDLLGHTMSVIVVKAEAARRLAPRDPDAALGQVADIESVGRQALAEIREAVTGYREGSLATDLDRARSALSAAGIAPAVRRSGPPLEPQAEVLLGWVVREAVTNAVRHSGAAHCAITVDGTAERVRLTVLDDGTGDGTGGAGKRTESAHSTGGGDGGEPAGGTGLKGLAERLVAVGGSLEAGPAHGSGTAPEAGTAPGAGFRVVAVLPVDPLSATGRPLDDAPARP